jgi:hypothetical protein
MRGLQVRLDILNDKGGVRALPHDLQLRPRPAPVASRPPVAIAEVKAVIPGGKA